MSIRLSLLLSFSCTRHGHTSPPPLAKPLAQLPASFLSRTLTQSPLSSAVMIVEPTFPYKLLASQRQKKAKVSRPGWPGC